MESKHDHFFISTSNGKIWADLDQAFFLSESDDYLFEAVFYYHQGPRLNYYYNIDGELQVLTEDQKIFLSEMLDAEILAVKQLINAERPYNSYDYE